MKNLVIVSAHPDDETIGAGGSYSTFKDDGYNLYWIIGTKMYENKLYDSNKIKLREVEIDMVSKLYGFKEVFNLNYNTNNTNNDVNKMIPKISSIFKDVSPEIVITMNRTDAHSDHRFLTEAVISSTKSFRFPSIKNVLMYECISETEFAPAFNERIFIPNYFIDVTNYFDKKIEVMKVFESEIDKHPFPRSIKNIEALATFRGATAGVKYAEAFQLVKFIDK